jgi:hypothetical protein
MSRAPARSVEDGQKGIKVTAAQMKSLNIRGDKFHPVWNYAVICQPQVGAVGDRHCIPIFARGRFQLPHLIESAPPGL